MRKGNLVRFMATRKSTWLGTLAVVTSLLVSAVASAQDFPTLKGTSSRIGSTNNPTLYGPGRTRLRWWTPNSGDSRFTTSMVVDNTDDGTYTANPIGTFTADPAWIVSPQAPFNSNNFDAPNSYLIQDNLGNERVPAYKYLKVTKALNAANQTLAASGTSRVATWNIVPPTTNAANYAVYVWVSIDAQDDHSVISKAAQYRVYEINASGRVYREVVNVWNSGGGWVRLGLSTSPNMVFPYDGINPITVSLFNTAPVDNVGNLLQKSDISKCVVYADAALVVPTQGFYDATPVSAQLIAGNAATTRTVAALNQFSSSSLNGNWRTYSTAVVTSYQFDTGQPIWSYSPVQSGTAATTIDNTTASATAGWANDNAATVYSGGYASECVIGTGAPTDNITYRPTLATGTYAIYAYLPGSNPSNINQTYGQAVQYNIYEGDRTLPPTVAYVNQNAVGGWVQIGTRRFTNIVSTAELTIDVTNGSNFAGDNGLKAYANAIRFVSQQDQTVSSTPVIKTVGILQQDKVTVLATQVVVVADRQGILHCLDAKGNNDGTTTEYWSYPSTLGTNGTDPNLATDPTAVYPSGFNMSSALVETVNSKDCLYIADSTGHVFCINMQGHGDFGATGLAGLQKSNVGTTSRIWTYPSTGNIGAIQGSVVFGDPVGGRPTLYVPSTQGRIYALDAVGSAGFTTTKRWAFPEVNKPVLGSIWTTPALQFGHLFFGTRQPADDSNGVFYCIDATLPNGPTSALWTFSGDTNTPSVGDFLGGPAVATYADINGGVSTNGIVYATNQNNYVYAFDAQAGTPLFETNELHVGSIGSITFSTQTTYDNFGALIPFQVILVPTMDGRFESLFADPTIGNQFAIDPITGLPNPFSGSREAFGFTTRSTLVASSLATSNNWLFGTDESGFLYAFNDSIAGYLSPGDPPGNETITANNPAGAIFRHAKLKLVDQTGYNLLRQPTGSNPSYIPGTTTHTYTRTPMAFEWGETIYVLVYDFPFVTSNGTSTVAPPTVNITFSSQGKTVRSIAAEARLFTEPPNAPNDPADPTQRDNGYAILSYTFQGGQNQSLPPGPGNISISISTSALNSSNIQQNVALNPLLSNFPFQMANPLALAMPDGNGNYADIVSLGLSISPSDAENLVNGSPKLAGTTKIENLLAQWTAVAQHGTSQTASVFVIDRSMMALQRPDNTGLDGVRLDMGGLAWQGGHLAIYKPLPLPYYANFEDYPDNFPNNSYDYPDIQSEQVSVVKDPNGTAENPRFNTVSLIPPLVKDTTTGQLRQMQLGDTPDMRVLQPTRFDMTVNVPKFQPANTHDQVSAAGALVANSANSTNMNEGYLSRVKVFVDSNPNGILDGAPSEAFRSFNFFTSVGVDEKIGVATPTVDLGTVPQGAGYSPLMPGSNYNTASPGSNGINVFQPWGGNFQNMFQPFVLQNLGNVNMVNLRVAKKSQFLANGTPTANPNPWGFFSNSNDLLGFLDGSVDMWSDMDGVFAPGGTGTGSPVGLQKARTTDIAPTQLAVNPISRPNPNLPGSGSILNPNFPSGPPHIGVSVPIGMPVGSYSNVVRIIENYTGNEIWRIFNNAPEPFSDPTFTLNFKVRESQLTGTSTAKTATMVDNNLLPTAVAPYAYSNKQPSIMRDPFGSLIIAWASDRPSWTPTQPTAASQLGSFSLFIASLGNSSTYSSTGVTGTLDPASSLSDLNNFQNASNSQWFKQAVNNYPSTAPSALFGLLGGEAIVAGTVQYGNPAFPTAGSKNPFNPSASFGAMYMAFTGDAQKQTQSGRINESRVFLSALTLSGGGTVSASAQPSVMTNDPQLEKGKPSVVQTANGAMLFYSGSAGSQSNIYYSDYGNSGAGSSFSSSVALPFGSSFQWASTPSASARVYNGLGEFKQGSSGLVQTLANGDPIVELTFIGQLQGRSNPEGFYGRLKADRSSLVVVDDNGVAATNSASNGNLFLDLAPVINEPLTSTGQNGLYRALGLQWNRSASIQVWQTLNGVTTNLLVDGTAVFDQQTGLISYDSRLGGKIYIDSTLGTVRFGSAAPNNKAVIYASYTPRFLRITTGSGEGYAAITGLYDAREISNPRYWRRANGNQADLSDDIKNGRYLFTFNRATGGVSKPPRPFISTLRFGVQLPSRIATDLNGDPISVVVNGVTRAAGTYQIDPANGRIYFSDIDEDNTVTVTYRALLENGQTINYAQPATKVSLIRELSEQQILIDNAVNESDLTSFLDPFSFLNQRRPPLIWLLWSSSRGGVPDLFLESISPQFSPVTIQN